ncbi:hypothetical protein PUN28_005014 [Cardiocondyla obscurior]|uniref:Uncharacterized protein n=1 Tax=Cardiocondyla obscurior TaxID=286306 RepID=A0AAW2GJM8_9HYME
MCFVCKCHISFYTPTIFEKLRKKNNVIRNLIRMRRTCETEYESTNVLNAKRILLFRRVKIAAANKNRKAKNARISRETKRSIKYPPTREEFRLYREKDSQGALYNIHILKLFFFFFFFFLQRDMHRQKFLYVNF